MGMDARLSAARQAGTCRQRGPSVTVREADGERDRLAAVGERKSQRDRGSRPRLHGSPARRSGLGSLVGHEPCAPQEYYASLPKHIAGAGAIFHDPDGKVLLVKPSYRDTWEIPGGNLKHGEYPFQAAARQVKEETGLELRPGRLLAVGWVPPPTAGRRSPISSSTAQRSGQFLKGRQVA